MFFTLPLACLFRISVQGRGGRSRSQEREALPSRPPARTPPLDGARALLRACFGPAAHAPRDSRPGLRRSPRCSSLEGRVVPRPPPREGGQPDARCHLRPPPDLKHNRIFGYLADDLTAASVRTAGVCTRPMAEQN